MTLQSSGWRPGLPQLCAQAGRMHVSRGRGRKDSGQNPGQNGTAPEAPGTRCLVGAEQEDKQDWGPSLPPGAPVLAGGWEGGSVASMDESGHGDSGFCAQDWASVSLQTTAAHPSPISVGSVC